MFGDFSDGLSSYLLPFLIAVPLALVIWFCTSRRGDDPLRGERGKDEDSSELPGTSRFAPPVRPSAPAAPTPAPAPSPPPPAGPVSVLLVDDSAVVRAKLGQLFQRAGYAVTLAKDGVEALQQLGAQRFDVLVTDLEMPNKDGFELIADVQGSLDTENLPIIAITGHDDMQARVHQVQGLYGIFKKPWNDRELLKRVDTLAQLNRR
ncbi:MAG TPA: response regulator [Burkholderiaceae bacterium]|jgi:CheY-like chemotaxis protein